MNAIGHVFELVDGTDDECYYPMGLFLTMEEAVAWVMGCDEPCGDADDVAIYEVRQRGIGFTGWSHHGKVVAKITWEQRLDEETDEWQWQKPLVAYTETGLALAAKQGEHGTRNACPERSRRAEPGTGAEGGLA